MIDLMKVVLTSLLLVVVYCDLPVESDVVESPAKCPTDFSATCNLQCPDGKYVVGGDGCPTCQCAEKAKVQCSRVMCRMFCQYGFKRDENGCEYCACNQSPQECPQLDCEDSCPNGYRKDYSGCQTCDCNDKPKEPPSGICPLIGCNMACKYGFERNENGCEICTCKRCPTTKCRMYCMYGFRKNDDDGCEICECDWTPIDERIQCDERIPCSGTRVCNLNLRLCEKVDPDRVNWFLYDFEVKNEDYLFEDEKFVQTFKNGLIHNIAAKYGFERTQITVSSVEKRGLTSFQIMPFFNEDMNAFEKKMDQIDIDLNTHEFRSLLPAVATAVDGDKGPTPSKEVSNKWSERIKTFIRSRSVLFIIIFLFVLIASIILIVYINVHRQYTKLSIRSDSKTPIYETGYHLAPSDEDYHYPVSAPDGTQYFVIASDENQGTNTKPAKV